MRKTVILLLVVLCLGTGMPKMYVKAAQDIVSHGNLIYGGKNRNASLYAEDIHLLEGKISTIPERCFDPVCYAHTHNWEYCRINERTHTRHCEDCGEANDLTSHHRADSWERDTITYKGKGYPGKRFTCACGYQWSMEMSHTMIYEAVDELNHRGRCALDGTPYCQGSESLVEEHYAWYYETSEDEVHHEKICFDCGFQMEEVCSFGKVDEDEDSRVCICGRSAEREEESEEPETGDPPKAPDKPGSEEPPGTSDESGDEEPPEIPEEPGDEEPPGTPDEPGDEEPPGTSDESENEDSPGAADRSGTEDALEEDNI